MQSDYNPWRDLRTRQHIIFVLHEVARVGGGAVYLRDDEATGIIIDPALSRVERKAALAHELVHDERGGIPVGAPAWLVQAEERSVNRIATARQVPIGQLVEWAVARAAIEPVTVADIAAEFDVPEVVAIRAIDLMRRTA